MGRGPTRYAGITDDELARALVAWFAKHAGTRNTWNRTITGRALKELLVAAGHFKHRPRGAGLEAEDLDPAPARAEVEPHPR